MNLIGLETSGDPATVAIVCGHDAPMQSTLHEPRRHNENLLPALDALLRGARWSLNDCDGVVFGRGPGSFTGARLASTVALALNAANGVSLLAVDSLMAHAEALRRQGDTVAASVAVAIDARMGEIYFARYRLDNDVWHVLQEPMLVAAAGPAPMVATSDIGVGDGWALPWLEPTRHQLAQTVNGIYAEAIDLLALAPVLLAKHGWTAIDECAPAYLRTAAAWR